MFLTILSSTIYIDICQTSFHSRNMSGDAERNMENDSGAEPSEDLRITYKIDDVPPWYMCLFLGFQHFLTMIGGTLSIPFILCPALCMR